MFLESSQNSNKEIVSEFYSNFLIFFAYLYILFFSSLNLSILAHFKCLKSSDSLELSTPPSSVELAFRRRKRDRAQGGEGKYAKVSGRKRIQKWLARTFTCVWYAWYQYHIFHQYIDTHIYHRDLRIFFLYKKIPKCRHGFLEMQKRKTSTSRISVPCEKRAKW